MASAWIMSLARVQAADKQSPFRETQRSSRAPTVGSAIRSGKVAKTGRRRGGRHRRERERIKKKRRRNITRETENDSKRAMLHAQSSPGKLFNHGTLTHAHMHDIYTYVSNNLNAHTDTIHPHLNIEHSYIWSKTAFSVSPCPVNDIGLSSFLFAPITFWSTNEGYCSKKNVLLTYFPLPYTWIREWDAERSRRPSIQCDKVLCQCRTRPPMRWDE